MHKSNVRKSNVRKSNVRNLIEQHASWTFLYDTRIVFSPFQPLSQDAFTEQKHSFFLAKFANSHILEFSHADNELDLDYLCEAASNIGFPPTSSFVQPLISNYAARQ